MDKPTGCLVQFKTCEECNLYPCKLIEHEAGKNKKYAGTIGNCQTCTFEKMHSNLCDTCDPSCRTGISYFKAEDAGLTCPNCEELQKQNIQLKRAIELYGNNPAGFDWAVLDKIDVLETENEKYKQAEKLRFPRLHEFYSDLQALYEQLQVELKEARKGCFGFIVNAEETLVEGIKRNYTEFDDCRIELKNKIKECEDLLKEIETSPPSRHVPNWVVIKIKKLFGEKKG